MSVEAQTAAAELVAANDHRDLAYAVAIFRGMKSRNRTAPTMIAESVQTVLQALEVAPEGTIEAIDTILAETATG